MSYLPKAEVERNIKERVRRDRNGNERVGWEAYFGTDPFTKEAVRRTRRTLEELKRDIRDFYLRHQAGGDAAVRLTAMEALDAKTAYDTLAAAGLKATLAEVARAYVDGGRGVERESNVTLGEAYREYAGRMPDGANKEKTVSTVGKWVAASGEGRRVSAVTAKEIAEYLEDGYGTKRPKTYNSHLQYIQTFLNWCCKEERGYLEKSPARTLMAKPEPWEEPEYMAVADVERLFRVLEGMKEESPELLAYAAVNFFCGCRAVEIQRMASDPEAAKIDLADETIRLAKAKGFQQGKRPRAFHIPPTALAWMRSFDFLTALKSVTGETANRIFAAARDAGVEMFHNCGRHTFITYHVAAYGEPSKTTAMVGTSEKMRADNYCGLASKAAGEAYFKIMPSETKEEAAP